MANDELKQIFHSEALEAQEQLNELFTKLEKDHSDLKAVDSIFRITHTLKANAEGMGFLGVSEMAHAMEDIFSAIRAGKLALDSEKFDILYRANDKLAELIASIKSGEKIRYVGLKTRLKAVLRDAVTLGESQTDASAQSPQKKPEKSVESSSSKDEIEKNTTDAKSIKELEDRENNKPQNDNLSADSKIKSDEQNPKKDTDNNNAKETKEQEVATITFSDLVQVPVQKLDHLMNLVGELVIERDRLINQSQALDPKYSLDYTRLLRISSELQYSVMNARLVKISTLFQKFHRVVRDAAVLEQKQVNLTLKGTEIEIDRNILQTISDSMIHLLRNAISHGLESPEERKKSGKPEVGSLNVSAFNDKESVAIVVADDGKGIDAQIIKRKAIEKGLLTSELAEKLTEQELVDFIFRAGFSSAEKITSLSGRGVGLDVVRKSIDSIGGKISIQTEVGKGTTFRLVLPSSMAVKSVLLFKLKDIVYAIPLTYTETVITVFKKDIHRVSKGLVSSYLNQTISVVFLTDLFETSNSQALLAIKPTLKSYQELAPDQKCYLIIVSVDSKLIGFVVDDVLQQKDIIEKPLRQPLESSKFFSGASIMGDGSVALVLDVPAVINTVFRAGSIGIND